LKKTTYHLIRELVGGFLGISRDFVEFSIISGDFVGIS
jgi:hypothetical protein